MLLYSKLKISLISLMVLMGLVALQTPSARGDDVVHAVSGAVKHVDKGMKTMVVKTSDGTEHTIKWTGETTWEGTEEAGEGIEEGSKVSVKYTEEAGEKTAVGVKHLGKGTAKALD